MLAWDWTHQEMYVFALVNHLIVLFITSFFSIISTICNVFQSERMDHFVRDIFAGTVIYLFLSNQPHNHLYLIGLVSPLRPTRFICRTCFLFSFMLSPVNVQELVSYVTVFLLLDAWHLFVFGSSFVLLACLLEVV